MPRTDNTKIDTPDETVTTTEYGVLYPNGTINWAEGDGGHSRHHLVNYAGTNYIIVSDDAVTERSTNHGVNGFERLVSAVSDNIRLAGGQVTTKPIVVKRMRIVTTTKAVPL